MVGRVPNSHSRDAHVYLNPPLPRSSWWNLSHCSFFKREKCEVTAKAFGKSSMVLVTGYLLSCCWHNSCHLQHQGMFSGITNMSAVSEKPSRIFYPTVKNLWVNNAQGGFPVHINAWELSRTLLKLSVFFWPETTFCIFTADLVSISSSLFVKVIETRNVLGWKGP